METLCREALTTSSSLISHTLLPQPQLGMVTTPKRQVEEMAIQAHVSALPRPFVPHHLGARASISIEFSMESTANLKLLWAKTAGRPHPQVQASPFLPLRGSDREALPGAALPWC